jgi:LysM repeat protein
MSIQVSRIVGLVIVIGMLLTPAAALAAPNSQDGTWHVVAAGETLSAIATRYGVTVAEIMSANQIGDANAIYAGQRLFIPESGSASSAAYGCANYHTIQAGDTLFSIAMRYGVTVSALMDANGLRSETIYAGQALCVTSDSAEAMPEVNAPAVPEMEAPPAYVPPSYQPPTPPQTGIAYAPPEYSPYPPGMVYPTTPATGQPSTIVTVPSELGQLPGVPQYPQYYAPPQASVALVRAHDTWIGNQTADPEDPQQATTLLVMVWDGKGASVVVRGAYGTVTRGIADVNYEFSWVPTVAFRGIAPGFYDVFIESEPSRVARAEVYPGHRPLVEFRKKSVTSENIAAVAAASGLRWAAEIVQNSNGTEPIGGASILVVRTGAEGQTIRVSAEGGFETTCRTGTKPEHGAGACDVGGLRAGTYKVILDGAGIGVEIYLDGVGTATIEFHPV